MTQRLHTSRGGTPPLKRKSAITDIVESDPLDRCNKTERLFFDYYLEGTIDYFGATILVQAVRLPLDGGGVYIPDFFQVWENGAIAYEVKGGYRGAGWEQGYERFKRAALQYARDDFQFILATFDRKRNEWDIQKWGGRQ